MIDGWRMCVWMSLGEGDHGWEGLCTRYGEGVHISLE